MTLSQTQIRVIVWALTLAFVIIGGGIGIFWARGFKLGPEKKLTRTGMIVATSIPDGAALYLDDRLTSATNTTIAFLEPKKYKVKIQKEGFTTWEKEVEVKADLATEIKALLFPQAPELKPLTLSGAKNPLFSPDGTKIAYQVEQEFGGIFILDLVDRPFGIRAVARQIVKNTPNLQFSSAKMLWSPDSRSLLVSLQEGQKEGKEFERNYILEQDRLNSNLLDKTANLATTLASWKEEIIQKENTLVFSIPQEIRQATGGATPLESKPKSQPAGRQAKTPKPSEATGEAQLINYYPSGFIFSPDESKALYQKVMQGNKVWHVYDSKKKKDYELSSISSKAILWYPDSEHLVLAEEGGIFIVEFDGQNKMAVFTGSYLNSFAAPYPNGTRIVILTTFAQAQGVAPNLYAINLR